MSNGETLQMFMGENAAKDNVHWLPRPVAWDEFCAHRVTLTKNKHAVPSYVFGEIVPTERAKCNGDCSGLHRSNQGVVSRSAISLDADFLDRDGDGDGDRLRERLKGLGVEALLYATYSSKPGSVRLRVVVPTDRPLLPDEYRGAARWLMRELGWDGELTEDNDKTKRFGPFDPGSQQYARLMYAQSSPPESPEPYRERFRGSFLDADLVMVYVEVTEPESLSQPISRPPADLSTPASPGEVAAAEEALRDVLATLAGMDAGSGRNNYLYEQGIYMFEYADGGCLDWDDVAERLRVAGLDSGLEAGEVDGTIESAQKRAEENGPNRPVTAESVFEQVGGGKGADPYAVLTGRVTRGLAGLDEVKPWRILNPGSRELAEEIVKMRWTKRGESGDETCLILRTWNGTPYEHHDTHWEPTPSGHLSAEISRILKMGATAKRDRDGNVVKNAKGKVKWVPIRVNPTVIAAVEKMIQHDTIVHARLASGHWIDCTNGRCLRGQFDRRHLSFVNGILDLETNVLDDHESAFFNTYSMRFRYDRTATAPLWEKTLEAWFPGDKESQDCLEEIVGYLVLGGMEMDKLFLFGGATRSGKGTVMRVVHSMLGTAFGAQSLAELGDRFGKEDLIGKRVVHITEAVGGPEARKVVSMMKAISGQDDGTVIKIKGGKSAQVDFECRFVLTGNEDLMLPDSSGVIADRIVALLMNQSFLGRENPNLTAQLIAESSGVFNRIRAAYDRLMERGRFIQPAAGAGVIEKIRQQAAPEKTWFQETFEVTGKLGDVVLMSNAVDRFREDLDFKGQDRSIQMRISALMKADGRVADARTRIGKDGARVRHFTGVRWLVNPLTGEPIEDE